MSGRSLEGAINAVETGGNARLFSPGADEMLVTLKKLAPGHELEQLFELEEMFYGQGRDIFTDESLSEIATHWNIDPEHFKASLDQPAALVATEKNLAIASELMGEIGSYPSVLLARDERFDAVSRGFVRYETVAARLADAMRDLGVPLEESRFCSLHNGCSLRGK